MQRFFTPAKLLVTIVGEHYAELVLEVLKEAGATGGTRAFGRGIAAYQFPGGLPGPDAPEDLIFSVIRRNPEGVFEAVVKAAEENPQNLSGMAMLLDSVGLFLRPDYRGTMQNDIEKNDGSTAMNSGTILITAIINHGQADEVMAVSRQNGARGGTVLDARGTGTEDDVKFFGISLAPEKEMLLIVAEREHSNDILQALGDLPLFSEPGGGIVFTMNVERFVLLGQRSADAV